MFTQIGLPAGSLRFNRRLAVFVAALVLLIGVAASGARTPAASAQCWGCGYGWNGAWNNWIGGTVWGNPSGNAYLSGYPYFFSAYPYYLGTPISSLYGSNLYGYAGTGYGSTLYGSGNIGYGGGGYGYGGGYGGIGYTGQFGCPPIPYNSCNFGGYPGYGPYSTYAAGLIPAVIAQNGGTPPVTTTLGTAPVSYSTSGYSTSGYSTSGNSCTYSTGGVVITISSTTANVSC